MSAAVQSPNKRQLLINGREIVGLSKDDPWNLTPTGDKATPIMDNSGSHVQYAISGDDSATLAVNLLSTSRSIPYLTSLVGEIIGDVADSVIPNAATMNIKGTISARGGAKSTLERMQSEGDILSYRGRLRMDKCVISNLKIDAVLKNISGYSFSATLTEIETAESKRVGITLSMSEQDSSKSDYTKNNSAPKTQGRKTTETEQLSTSSYSGYVNSYNGKQYTSGTAENNKSYNGTGGK